MKSLLFGAVLGLSAFSFAQENVPIKVLQDRSFRSAVKHLSVDPRQSQRCVVCLANNSVEYYDGSLWQQLEYAGNDAAVKKVSVDWSQRAPRVMLGLESGAVMYYNGRYFAQLRGCCTGTGVTKMSVDWEGVQPRAVIGLGCGGVMYYDGAAFNELQSCGRGSPIAKMSVDWSLGVPRVVTGQECGAVRYYDGRTFSELNNCMWMSRPAKMKVDWSGSRPRIVVALESSAVEYYDGQNFSELHDASWNEKAAQMSVDWTDRGPRIVLGARGGSVEYYGVGVWLELHDRSWRLPISKMAVDWAAAGLPRIVAGLGVRCNGCPLHDAKEGGAVEYFDGQYWRELHDNSWKSPISFLSVKWEPRRDPLIAIGQGAFYWRTIIGAREAPSQIAVFANGQWVQQAVYQNPVCAMDVKWASGPEFPIILYCLGKNKAAEHDHRPQDRNVFNIIITEN